LTGNFFDIIGVGCGNNSGQYVIRQGGNRVERGDGFDFELVQLLNGL
jgi:hypothetical protein